MEIISEKISVVLAVYIKDNLVFLKESIQSLLDQTFQASEIIIVVDGIINEDVTIYLDYLAINDDLFNVIKLPENKGLANALNIGVKAAKYNLIARMDADDICFPDRFEKQVKYINKESLDIVGGQIIEFGKDINDVISERNVPLLHNDIVSFLKFRSPFSHPTILFTKNVFNSVNGYSVTIFPEDYDFFVRAFLGGFKFGNIEDNVLWFRLGANYSDAIKRRWGLKYAINEFKLYVHFLILGFYNFKDFLKAVLFKIPLRVTPFFIYKYLYFNVLRKG